MAGTLSYKIQYHAGVETQVRRFCLDKEVSSSFAYLEEKLCHVFPQLRRQVFRIQWTDEEGDLVCVGNDEDLGIALAEMKGSLYKFIVKIFTQGKSKAATESSEIIHHGVECDGCEGKVVGFRYKCLVCEDFDLCGNCEASGHHPEHDMIRIINPQVIWPQHVFSPLRIRNQFKDTSGEEERKRSKMNNGNKYKHGKPTLAAFLGPVLEEIIKALAGTQTEGQENGNHISKFKNNNDNECFDHASGKDQNVVQKTEKKSPEEEKTENESVDQPQNNIEPEKEKINGNQSPPLSDDGDWNVIEKNEEKIEETDQELPEVLYGSVNGTLYPTLPENKTPPTKGTETIASSVSKVTPSVIAEHSDPKVQIALLAMTNMGFTNDGGWLTNLLEAKQGNIGKTLDVLQPSRN